jgi:type III pantothenate kinase
MSMLLVIDVGNTNTVLGVYQGERLLHHWRVFTDRDKTSDEYGILVRNLYDVSHFSSQEIKAIAVSSVVPTLTPTIVDLCERYFGISPMVVGPGIRTGISIKVDNPKEVGADRIVNAAAAHAKHGKACIVVDFGTATTFDYVAGNGDYMGGVIAPGVGISAEALFRVASKLPRVEITKPPTVIGKNTVAAMQSGLFYGYVALVEGIIDRMKKELRSDPLVIATGGLARRISAESSKIHVIDENLTLEGLRIIYERNQSPGHERA